MNFPTITMNELEQFSDQDRIMEIIDLRNRPSFEKFHWKNAINIPFQELESQIMRLPGDRMLVFYCSRGGQSLMACSRLSQMGYQVVNVANGISFYQGKYLVRG